MSARIVAGPNIPIQPVPWLQVRPPSDHGMPFPALEETPSAPAAEPIQQVPAVELDALRGELEARLRSVQQEMAGKVREARAQGVQEGHLAVEQAMAQQRGQEAQAMRSLVEELSGYRSKLRHRAEQDVVQLSLAVARKVLNRELQVDADALLSLVRVSLEKLDQRDVLELRVAEADHARLQASLTASEALRHTKLVVDPTLRPGSAVVETSRGTLDASLDTQLSEIERGFTDLLRRRT